jgi:hypothetical protein
MTHHMMGKYEEAETLACQVLETHRRIYGSDHPETTRYAENLSLINLHIRKYQETEDLTRQLLDKKRKFGELRTSTF